MIADRVKAATKGKKKMTIAQLVQAMEEPATEDLRGDKLLPIIFKAIGKPKSAKLRKALATLKTWQKHGAHRRDLNRDGVDEETPAIELMDAWWPKLVEAEFKPALGSKAYERLEGMLEIGRRRRRLADAPDFDDGWWSYVYKDLRDLFGPTAEGPVEPRLLRRRLEAKCSGGAAEDARRSAQGDAGEALRRRQRRLRREPAAVLLRPEPAHGHGRDHLGPVPVPEPADLPAGRDAD